MEVLKEFKTAQKLVKHRQFEIAFCEKTDCNKDNVMAPYSPILSPNPIPYYPLSYPEQIHPHPKKHLENAVVFQTTNQEVITFSGLPDAKSKSWMEFRIYCTPEYSSAIYKLRYTFDVKHSKYNESSGIISDHIVEDDSAVKPGKKMSVEIRPSKNWYNLWVNGKDRKFAYGDTRANCSKMLVYGGKWSDIEATTRDTSLSKTIQKLSPLEPSFAPDSSKYSSCDPDDIKYMIPDPNVRFASTKNHTVKEGNLTIIKVELINPLQAYGLADIEFRKTLCEFSDLIKVQIRSISVGADPNFRYYTKIWTRKNYLWSKFDDDEARLERTSCAKFYVGVSEKDNVMFFCDNFTIFSLPINGSFAMAQFSAQSIKKEFACF